MLAVDFMAHKAYALYNSSRAATNIMKGAQSVEAILIP